MKIYGIQIIFPHSGAVSRSKVIPLMLAAMQLNHRQNVTKENLKELCEKSKYDLFVIQDVNYELSGHFKIVV